MIAEGTTEIVALDADAYARAIPGLAALLVDAVDGGASVNFLDGTTLDEARGWWEGRTGAVRDGVITVFVARDTADGAILGSTLIERSTNPNSPHRAEIGKVLVLRRARRRGLASALMTAAEDLARSDGRWLLLLDTMAGSEAEAMYRHLGWREYGVVPAHALTTSGEPWPTTFFYKDLR